MLETKEEFELYVEKNISSCLELIEDQTLESISEKKFYFKNLEEYFISLWKNLDSDQSIGLFGIFLSILKKKIEEVKNIQVLCPYDAFMQINKLKNRQRFCASFFQYCDPSNFDLKQISEIILTIKKSEIEEIFSIETNDFLMFPCINVFLRDPNRSLTEKNSIIKLARKTINHVKKSPNQIIKSPKNILEIYSYDYNILYENFYPFCEINRFYIYKLREILKNHFKTKKVFKNFWILKFPYLE